MPVSRRTEPGQLDGERRRRTPVGRDTFDARGSDLEKKNTFRGWPGYVQVEKVRAFASGDIAIENISGTQFYIFLDVCHIPLEIVKTNDDFCLVVHLSGNKSFIGGI